MEKYTGLEVAVIGLAGKFPQADNINEYWANLVNGKDCVSDFSEEEIVSEGESVSAVKDPMYVRSNAYLENKQFFDAAFFGYRSHEAGLMDPQIRLFHECCWEALEDSGYSTENVNEKIGLFAAGSSNPDWEIYAMLHNKEGLVDDFSASQLRDIGYLATKVAYKLNLRGPAVFLQTACSSSLVAIHQAFNSLLLGECEMAIAGGVSVNNYSKRGYLYQPGMIFSKDGRCRPFDEQSSGTIPGEGVGVVVLKRLQDAIRDKDHVYAVIKGSAINNDGSDKAGFTAPGVKGQIDVIGKAHKMAGVNPASITYVEAHGTATVLGDAIEIEALNRAFANAATGSCAIGSVKSNIGHLDVAAGVAGFIKTVLSLKHKKLPPSLHYTKPNPGIEFNKGPFHVNKDLQDWNSPKGLLRAGVSSFGIGGTNVHIVLEEAVIAPELSASRKTQLLTFSAKTPNSLEQNIRQFTSYLQANENSSLADMAYTLKVGKTAFPYRRAIVCETKEEALRKLSDERSVAHHTGPHLQNIVFMFSGQGTQYVDMCRDLYTSEQPFREKIEECLRISQQYSTADFRSVLLAGNTADARINDTAYTQPLLFMVEYALAYHFMQLGVIPDLMIGHSIGEYVAACISGVLSLEDALRLVIRRGALMARVEKGSMLSISVDEATAKSLLSAYSNIDIAVINSHGTVVVAGKEEDIAVFQKAITAEGIKNKIIATSHAFHSYMMEAILKDFEEEVKAVTIHPPRMSYVSNLHGNFVEYEDVKEPSYWSQHIRQTVQFAQGTDLLLKEGPAIFIEIGPGRALCNYVSNNPFFTEEHVLVNTIRQSHEKVNDQYYLTEKIGQLWQAGVAFNWHHYYAGESRAKLPLPTYSFEKTAFPVNVDVVQLLEKEYGGVTASRSAGVNIYGATWYKTLIPKTVNNLSSTILVFSGKENFSTRLVTYLQEQGHRVITASEGPRFEVIHADAVEVDITDLTALWNYLATQHITPHHIVYNAALEEAVTTVEEGQIAGKMRQGYLALCYLAQSLAVLKPEQDIAITVFNNYVANVFDGEALNSLKSSILGAVKVMPSELMKVTCKLVDIPYPFNSSEDAAKYVPGLAGELFYDTHLPLIAYRMGQRWKPGFEQREAGEETSSGVNIVRNGTYIVTGGSGGIGFSIARDLVYKEAQVIIVHRSPLSLPVADQVLLMRTEGLKVDLYEADIAKEEEVRELLQSVKNDHGRVNGLIWSAGEVDRGGIIQNRSSEELTRYMDSKVKGLLLFQRYLDFSTLDFVALFSSIGNVFYQSKFGQVAYNGANEFIESYAGYIRNRFGIHAFSINWCDWRDVGMTVKTMQKDLGAADIRSINEQITDGIYPSEGISAFHECLGSQSLSSTIYRGDLHEAIRAHQAEFEAFREEMTGLTVDSTERDLRQDSSMEEKVNDIFCEFFGRPVIGNEENFFELGGDSLEGMTLIARINKKLGVRLAIGDLYKYPNIQLLVSYLSDTGSRQEFSDIPHAPLKEDYLLSSSQRRMYFLQQLNKESTAYNGVQILVLDGIPDKHKIKDSIEQLLHRHEILRTRFEVLNGVIVQKIEAEVAFELEEYDAEGQDPEILIHRFVRAFDLSQAPVFRAGLIRIDPLSHILLFDMHHIVTDGVSNNILGRDFMNLYNGKALAPLRLQYKDFAEWQQNDAEQQRILAQKDYWMGQYLDLPAPLELPLDFIRPLTKSTDGAKLADELPATLTTGLKKLAEKEGVSMFMLLLSAYHILLSKLSGQQDIVVGVSTAGRLHADLEGVMGMFVNTLPLRNHSSAEASFRSFLQQVKANALSGFDNQEYQYEDIVESLGVARDMSRNPLFDVMFSYENFDDVELELEGLRLKPYQEKHQISKFDLTLIAGEEDDRLVINFEYSTALFRQDTVERIAAYFKRIVAAVVADANISLKDINILEERESERLLKVFNDTASSYATEKTVVDLFEEQAYRTPDATALIFENTEMSYKELHALSDQVAMYLHGKFAIGAGDLVGVILDRSIDLVPVLLGILKTGAAYVPIDPSYPQSRVALILRDAAVKLVLDSERTAIILHAAATYTDKALPVKPVGTDLAYVIYTSGSTGQPKGVMIAHQSLVNYLRWGWSHYIHQTGETIFSLHSSISFDLTVTSLFLPLISGNQLKIFGGGNNPGVIEEVVKDPLVNVIKLTPSHLKLIRNIPVQARPVKFIIGGEQLERSVAKAVYEQYEGQATLYNEYGPTESTVGCMLYTYHPEDAGHAVPIGKPIWNTQLYVLDTYQQPVPMGVAGELYIGGDGLALGYVNNEVLTAAKFIDSPFEAGARLYRTGDKVRMLSWDKMVYLGRLDDQVKLRGYRIELGEIAEVMRAYESITDSIAVVKGEDSDRYLCGYYVAPNVLDEAALKTHLQDHLPAYMIPDYITRLEAIPLTHNGKVDQKALPDMIISAGDDYTAPSSEIEEKLVDIWADVLQLNKEDISVNRSFFELGGNSLEIVALTHKIRVTFNSNIGITDMFSLTTILAIKEFLLKGDSHRLESIRDNIAYAIDDAAGDLKLLEDI